MPVTSWSTTAANNNASPPNGWPEGMVASAVNDTARQMMADLVTEFQKNAVKVLGSVAGTNTITASLTPALVSYAAGMLVVFTPAGNNTGATTININSLGALDVLKADGDALISGDLVSGVPALLVLDSGADDFILLNPQSIDAAQLGSGTLADARVAASNVTQHQDAITSIGNATVDDSAGSPFSIGYRLIPQNSQSTSYTAVLADADKHIYHPSATVGGATFGSLATAGSATNPRARHIGVVGQFVVVGDTNETANGAVQYRIQWGAINQPRNFPLPGSATAIAAQAGEQFLEADRGAVTGIFSGDQYGLIAQKTAITRMTYVGGSVVFQFDVIDRERGVWFPNSAIQMGSLVFFASFDGFYVTDGVSVRPIGNGKVDKTFLADCDQTYLERVRAAIDYQNKCVVWVYPNASATNGNPNRVLFYNWVENRWAHAEDELALIFPSYSEALTLDALDTLYTSLDDIGISLDAPILQGGIKSMMGFGTDNRLGTFSGAAPVARFETGEFEPNAMGYFFVSGVLPQVTGLPSGITVALSSRLTQDNTSRSFGTAVSRTSRTGICDFRDTLRYGSLRMEVTGGFDRAIGCQVIGQDAGQL